MPLLECIEIQTQDSVCASVIWLHGLGASADDFVPIINELQLPPDAAIRFVFPNAPSIPVTVNAGYIMPAWYDILELTEERVINEEHLIASVAAVQALIEQEEKRGISSDKILLAGFSQGGAIAYHAALTYSNTLAGLLGLSTYFPLVKNLSQHMSNAKLPIMVAHGSNDPMVFERQGKKAAQHLKALGHTVDYHSYPMEHEVCAAEIIDISRFIQDRLL